MEKFKRLKAVREYRDNGLSPTEIATKTGLKYDTVHRNLTYLKNLEESDLTTEEVSEKRALLFVELSQAAEEAKELFDLYKQPIDCKSCKGSGEVKDGDNVDACVRCRGFGIITNPLDANRFLKSWVDVLQQIAKLYGLDNVKNDTVTINQQFNTTNGYVSDRINIDAADRLAKVIISDHENKLKKKHEKTI